MLIRNQKKTLLINLDGASAVCISKIDGKFHVQWLTGSADLLGVYSTEEKAIRVLDMIQKQYEIVNTVNYTEMYGVAAMKAVNNLDYLHVFQMPTESEVDG